MATLENKQSVDQESTSKFVLPQGEILQVADFSAQEAQDGNEADAILEELENSDINLENPGGPYNVRDMKSLKKLGNEVNQLSKKQLNKYKKEIENYLKEIPGEPGKTKPNFLEPESEDANNRNKVNEKYYERSKKYSDIVYNLNDVLAKISKRISSFDPIVTPIPVPVNNGG